MLFSRSLSASFQKVAMWIFVREYEQMKKLIRLWTCSTHFPLIYSLSAPLKRQTFQLKSYSCSCFGSHSVCLFFHIYDLTTKTLTEQWKSFPKRLYNLLSKIIMWFYSIFSMKIHSWKSFGVTYSGYSTDLCKFISISTFGWVFV